MKKRVQFHGEAVNSLCLPAGGRPQDTGRWGRQAATRLAASDGASQGHTKQLFQ